MVLNLKFGGEYFDHYISSPAHLLRGCERLVQQNDGDVAAWRHHGPRAHSV